MWKRNDKKSYTLIQKKDNKEFICVNPEFSFQHLLDESYRYNSKHESYIKYHTTDGGEINNITIDFNPYSRCCEKLNILLYEGKATPEIIGKLPVRMNAYNIKELNEKNRAAYYKYKPYLSYYEPEKEYLYNDDIYRREEFNTAITNKFQEDFTHNSSQGNDTDYIRSYSQVVRKNMPQTPINVKITFEYHNFNDYNNIIMYDGNYMCLTELNHEYNDYVIVYFEGDNNKTISLVYWNSQSGQYSHDFYIKEFDSNDNVKSTHYASI